MNIVTFLKVQWDRVGSWVAIGIGAIVLLLGWIGISSTPHVAAQLPYIISGGLFGIFLLGIGGMLWVSADLRDEWRELHSIRAAVERVAGESAAATEPVRTFAEAAFDPSIDLDDATGPIETTTVTRNGARTNGARTRRPARTAAGKGQ